MKKYGCVAGGVLLLLTVLPLSGLTQAQNLFSDNFESGNLTAWKIDKIGLVPETVSWKLVSDTTQVWEARGGESWGHGNSYATLTDYSAADVIVSAKVKPVEIFNAGHWSGVVARYTDTTHFYVLTLNASGTRVWLANVNGAQNGETLGIATLPESTLGVWTNLRLEIIGTRIKAYVNDVLYFDLNDNTHTGGSAGLANAACVTRFDDFVFSLAWDSTIVTKPNGGESFLAKSTQTIRWRSLTDLPQVNLAYSTNNGVTWTSIASNVENKGEFEWTLPDIDSDSCLIQVMGSLYGNDFVDTSDKPFTIYVCRTHFSADFNGDCKVDLVDFAEFASQWFKCGNPADPSCLPFIPAMDFIASYSFEEGQGTAVLDQSGNHQDGVANNGPTWVPGVYGSALQFDGVDDYVVLNDETKFRLTSGTLTMSFWLKTTQVTHGTILMKNSGWVDESASGWILFVGGGKVYSVVSAQNSWVALQSTAAVNDGYWHHIVVQMGDKGRKIYIDGLLDAQDLTMTAVAIWENYDPTPLSFGAERRVTHNWWDGFYNGLLDEVRIYDRVLSDTEVKTLYQNP